MQKYQKLCVKALKAKGWTFHPSFPLTETEAEKAWQTGILDFGRLQKNFEYKSRLLFQCMAFKPPEI
jgi:hypothetical protein